MFFFNRRFIRYTFYYSQWVTACWVIQKTLVSSLHHLLASQHNTEGDFCPQDLFRRSKIHLWGKNLKQFLVAASLLSPMTSHFPLSSNRLVVSALHGYCADLQMCTTPRLASSTPTTSYSLGCELAGTCQRWALWSKVPTKFLVSSIVHRDHLIKIGSCPNLTSTNGLSLRKHLCQS